MTDLLLFPVPTQTNDAISLFLQGRKQCLCLLTPLQHGAMSVRTAHTVIGLYFIDVTSHDETKAVPLFVQTDVDCL